MFDLTLRKDICSVEIIPSQKCAMLVKVSFLERMAEVADTIWRQVAP